MTINKWPLSERPREKLLQIGAKNLSDAELLAIFFRTGIRGKTALDLARDLLQKFSSLKELLNISVNVFCQTPGMGTAKFVLLQAALELGQRYQEERIKIGEQLNNSAQTKRFLASRLRHHSREVFACLFLDSQNRFIGFEELFHGTLSETNVYPREVVKRSLAHNAAKVILAHNHPSGDPTPSHADHEMTKILKQSLALIDIQVIDHIIVGNLNCWSLAETGFF